MESTGEVEARGVEHVMVWLVLPEPSVRTQLIFFMPNSLVQPLALCGAHWPGLSPNERPSRTAVLAHKGLGKGWGPEVTVR